MRADKRLQAYYAERGLKEHTPWNGFFRASGIGKCDRAIGYWILGKELAETEYESYMPMYLGTLIHKALQEGMIASGVNITDCEVELKKTYTTLGGELVIIGHQDGKRNLKGNRTVLTEIKTFSIWRFKKFVAASARDLWDRWNGFYREMIQCQAYMDMGGHIGAEVWAVNRSNGQFMLIKEKKNTPALEERIEELGKILDLASENRLPERPLPPSHILCKLCEYRFHCHGKRAQSFEAR